MKLHGQVVLKVIAVVLLLSLAIGLAKFRSLDWSDEGLYLYDAWAFANGVSQSNPKYVNQGYIVGLPGYLAGLIGVEHSALIARFFSVSLLIVAFYLFVKNITTQWWFPILTTFYLFQSLYLPTLSYQTLPILLLALGCSMGMKLIDGVPSDLGRSRARPLFFLGVFFTMHPLVYLPSVFLLPVLFLLIFSFKELRENWKLILSGALVGAVVVASIYFVELTRDTNRVEYFSINSYQTVLAEGFKKLFLTLDYAYPKLLVGLLFAFTVHFALRNVRKFDDKKVLAKQLGQTLILAGITLYGTYQILAPKRSFWYQTRFLDVAMILLPISIFVIAKNKHIWRRVVFSSVALLSFALLQISFGTNQPNYYLSFLSPYLFLLPTIALCLFAENSQRFQRFLPIVFASVVGLISIATTLHFSYRGESLLNSTAVVSQGALRGLSSSPERIGALTLLRQLYDKHECEKKFFASIDRTPLSYVAVERASPWGVSWIGDRQTNFADELNKNEELCLVFRVRNEDAQQNLLEFLKRTADEIVALEVMPSDNGGIYFASFSSK